MTEQEENKGWFEKFAADTIGPEQDIGYIQIPTNVPGAVTGSVFLASLRQENTIGSLIKRPTMFALDEETAKDYKFTNYIDKIPEDLIQYADRFYGARSEEDFELMESQIRQELRDRALLSQHPIQAFAYGAFTDPVNWVPVGGLYKSIKAGSRLARNMIGTGLVAAGSTAVSEAVLRNTQLTRELDESLFNIAASGVVGAALGGVGAGIGIARSKSRIEAYQSRKRAHQEVLDVLTEKDMKLDQNGLRASEDLARMPESVRKAMKFTPMNRLINSRFGLSKWFASQAYEHNYTLVKNTDGISNGISIQRNMQIDFGRVSKAMVDYQDIYFEMHGVQSGVFRGARSKLSNVEMTKDQFDDAVSLVLTTNEAHPKEHVNRAAKLLRERVFEHYKKEAIKNGILTEDVTVPNAVDYFMIMYNKNKIIEQGGKGARGAGTFPQYVFDQFKTAQEITKQYKSSPVFIARQTEIKTLRERLKKIPAAELNKINNHVKSLDKKINELERLKVSRPRNEVLKINKNIKELKEKQRILKTQIDLEQKEYQRQIDEEIKSHAGGRNIYKERIKQLRKQENEFKRKITVHAARINEFKGRIKEIKKETPKKERLQQSVANAQDTIKELHSKIDRLNESVKEAHEHIKSHEQRIQELRKIRKEPANPVIELREQFGNLDSEINLLEKSKRPTPDEIRAYQKTIKELESEKQKVLKSKELSKKQKKEITNKITELEQRIKDDAPPGAKDHEGELYRLVDDDTLWANVEQTIDNILGHTDGKLLNPFLAGLTGASKKPLKGRKLLIDQAGAREWHVTNAVKVAHAYSRAMIPAIRLTEFAKRLGFNDIPEMREGLGKRLKDEYDKLAKGMTGKEAQKLRKQLDEDVRDINATFDLLLGIYGDGPNVLNNKAKDFYQNFLNWNYTRMLGGMTITSIADAGALVFTHGAFNTISAGLKTLIPSLKAITKQDLQAIGYALETDLGSRLASYSEHLGLSTNPGPFTRAIDSLTRTFGNLSLMNHWNNSMHLWAGTLSVNRTLQAIHKVATGGSIPKIESERLARLGIDPKNFDIIYKFTKDNRDNSGTLFADWSNWNVTNAREAQALREFQASVGKEIDSIIIVPGIGDKPLLAHKTVNDFPVGKFLLQFKSFSLAATNRLLFSGIQRRNDMNVYQGVVSMLSLGALSYAIKSYLQNDEPDLSYNKLAREAVDRSGLLGIFGEGINIGTQMLNIGGVSRYNNDFATLAFGPGVGAINDMTAVLRKVLASTTEEDTDLTTKDAEKILRLMPYQNLFYLNRLNKVATRQVAEELGATPVDN